MINYQHHVYQQHLNIRQHENMIKMKVGESFTALNLSFTRGVRHNEHIMCRNLVQQKSICKKGELDIRKNTSKTEVNKPEEHVWGSPS